VCVQEKNILKNICSVKFKKSSKLLPVVMTFGYFSFYSYIFSMCQKEFCAVENSSPRKLIGHNLSVTGSMAEIVSIFSTFSKQFS
jgi:hypothetical protein